ncbi:Gfo/Idh/MocA family oxidoreductase [Chakrabartyella piscis]|uniref:Gfo/Idh/MocA family protein n=1 Tax=Chakrabartyella piscis TaxID=2918914 RepID=UPI002958DCF4|nr:Gfo/Idh/MocA family oxidoreductase [Chakrabartyella piscis]
MADKIRFGVIGMGFQGSLYAKLLWGDGAVFGAKAPEHGVLAALSSRDEKKRAGFAELYPNVPFFTDWKEMVTSGTVDAVIIATPHKNHPELTMYCLEHGIHVLLDKPAGLHVKEVAAMNRCSAAHPDVTFGMIFNQRTNPLYQRAKDIVSSGELGKVRRIHWTSTNWWRPDRYYDQSAWRGTWGGEGGGILMNQTPHQLDLWQWICGMPKSLYANVEFGLHREISVDNDVTLVAEYGDGVTGVYIACAHDIVGLDRLEISFDGGKVVITENGKKGEIYRLEATEMELNQSMEMDRVKDFIQGKPLVGLYTVEELSCSEGFGLQHTLTMENFALHILEGTPLLIPGVEGINSLELANGALLSSWTGQKVSLPIDEDVYLEQLNKQIKNEGLFDILS